MTVECRIHDAFAMMIFAIMQQILCLTATASLQQLEGREGA